MNKPSKPGAPARPKIQTLKPTIKMADLSIGTPLKPLSAARVTGRRLQEKRRRWFAAHPLCVHCEQRGLTVLATDLDHVTPLFRGGRDDGPVQGLCVDCHKAKTAEELRGGGIL